MLKKALKIKYFENKLKIKNIFAKIPELFKFFQIKYFNTIEKDKL